MTNHPPIRSAFEKWLHENHLTYAQAGKLFGCSGENVRLIAHGQRIPGDDLGRRILDALLSHKLPTRPCEDIAAGNSSPAQAAPCAGEAFSTSGAAA